MSDSSKRYAHRRAAYNEAFNGDLWRKVNACVTVNASKVFTNHFHLLRLFRISTASFIDVINADGYTLTRQALEDYANGRQKRAISLSTLVLPVIYWQRYGFTLADFLTMDMSKLTYSDLRARLVH